MRLIIKSMLLMSLLWGCSSVPDEEHPEPEPVAIGSAKLNSTKYPSFNGVIEVNRKDDGIEIVTFVSGLKSNSVHGYHIHQYGKCEGSDYKSAGDHYNPQGHPHGSPNEEARHLGDLGNIKTGPTGESTTIFEMKITKREIQELNGKAVVLHEKKDDFSTQPSGNSGERIACGILKIGGPELK